MKCPRCQRENPSGQKFCGECGTPLTAELGGTAARAYQEVTGALSEALEQQSATAEILRVISSSPTDIQPVFDAIVRSASMLCGGEWAIAVRYDGELLHLVAHHNPRPRGGEMLERLFPHRADRSVATGRAILDRATVQILNTAEDPDLDQNAARLARSFLAVPLLLDGNAIGAIGVSRGVPGAFSEKQVALLQAFASQAVIAIENVRLFNETKEALERQTATSEILRVIGSSPTDVQPVFETIARSGVSVCAALGCAVFIVDRDMLRVAATHGVRSERVERFRREYPIPLDVEIDTAQTIRQRRIFHLADIEHNLNATPSDIECARLAGYRTRLMVPMV